MDRVVLRSQLQQLQEKQELLWSEITSHSSRIAQLERHLNAEEEESLASQPTEKFTPIAEEENIFAPPPLPTQTPPREEKTETPSNIAPDKPPLQPINAAFLERQVGRIWLVRIGIITMLTGLVFLSNYAYNHFIVEWSAWPRVIGLYAISLLFITGGNLLQKSKEALSSYGAVLAAGGLAILYYTSYAAYHVERLKIINQPLLAGILLLLTALYCLQYALSRGSSVTAILSLGLAFYSTSINPVGAFTLISSTILMAIGIILFIRLKNLGIGFCALIGAYGSYSYWQLFINLNDGSPLAHYFVIPYWILGLLALCLAPALKDPKHSIPFASLNNALFFVLFSMDFNKATWIDPFWPFPALMGVALLAMAIIILPKSTIHSRPLCHCFLGKGLALITLSLCTWLTGPSLAISLALQAGLLLVLNRPKKSTLLTVFAGLNLILSFIALCSTSINTPSTSMALSLIYLATGSLWLRQQHLAKDILHLTAKIPLLFAVVATALWIYSANISSESKILCLLLAATLYNLPLLIKKGNQYLGDLPYLAHLLTGVALVTSLYHFPQSPLFYSLSTLILAGQFSLQLFARKRTLGIAHPVYLALAHLSLCGLMASTLDLDQIFIPMALLPIGYHFLYQKFKSRSFVILAMLQYLPAGALLLLAMDFGPNTPKAVFLIAVLTPLAHYFLLRYKSLKEIPYAAAYLVAGSTLLLAFWLSQCTPHWQLFLAITGLVYLVIEKHKEFGPLTAVATVAITLSGLYAASTEAPILLRYTISLIFFASFFLIRQSTKTEWKHELSKLFAFLCCGFLVLTTTQHCSAWGGYSICWALVGFALLSLGLYLKENVFRSLGFLLLALCVGHVYLVDVWQLGTLLRIASFITLGAVLLMAGYLYCRLSTSKE